LRSDGRKRGVASLDFLKSVADQAESRGIQINLYHKGEPLLNKEFYPACRYAADRGLWTTIHSNLSLRLDNLAEKIVAAGLCNLVVSCDGATQETYEKYRVQGDVDLVFANMQAIANEKRRVASKLPWITAKFLIFDHNWHEMKMFRDRALECGANEVLFAPAGMGGFYDTRRGGTGRDFDLKRLDWVTAPPLPNTGGGDPGDHLVMDHDGATFPCCLPFRDQDLFVTPEESSRMTIMEMWNHPNYLRVRDFFLRKSTAAADTLPGACSSCSIPARFGTEAGGGGES
jgi:MoaA/NifB/PqqE/SkfB family radical SAM enzyme